jgi:N-acetylmuramoyl-L-alanine amidase
MRRELLRQAVTENVYERLGRRVPPPRRRGRLWLLLLSVGGAAAALATGGLMLPGALPLDAVDTPESAAEVAAAQPLPRVAARPSPATAASEGRRFSSPGTFDSAVLPLSVRRIVLDPGHGGRDVGTVTSEGMYEKDLALDIALRLRDLLVGKGGVEVLLTRERDERVLLRDRARFANEAGADLFVSIHLNWLEPRTRRGVETFFLGPTEDPVLVQLTSRENRESGYSLADARRLLDGIYFDLRQEQSRRLADSVQRKLHGSLRRMSPDLEDRGVKPAPFLVLVATEMPAILAEVSCLSNAEEARLLGASEYRQNIARALFEGIDSYIVHLAQEDSRGSAHDSQEG